VFRSCLGSKILTSFPSRYEYSCLTLNESEIFSSVPVFQKSILRSCVAQTNIQNSTLKRIYIAITAASSCAMRSRCKQIHFMLSTDINLIEKVYKLDKKPRVKSRVPIATQHSLIKERVKEASTQVMRAE